MGRERWAAVDRYLGDQLLGPDAVMEAVLRENARAGLPAHDVSPTQGKFLFLLAKIHGARSILEIGTLGGYSTLWLARSLSPSGDLVTLESDATHAEVAKRNIERAGFAPRVDVRVGAALDSLPALADEQRRFDLIFIDADKPSNPVYFEWALRLSRSGTLIVIDNVIRDGQVIEEGSPDPNVQGVRRMNAMIAAEPRVSATALQTVGNKGYDGFAMALVLEDSAEGDA